MLDLYCERLATGLWGEPLNSVSNLGFIFAAVASFRLGQIHQQRDTRLLAVLIFAIGCGSTAFHMVADHLTQWLDVVPIALFQISFLALYLARVVNARVVVMSTALAAFISVSVLSNLNGALLNGSVGYVPALIALALLGAHQSHRGVPHRLWVAAAIFSASLSFRTIDNAFCSSWPHGTHFMWHLLNAVLLYLLVSEYAAERDRARYDSG